MQFIIVVMKHSNFAKGKVNYNVHKYSHPYSRSGPLKTRRLNFIIGYYTSLDNCHLYWNVSSKTIWDYMIVYCTTMYHSLFFSTVLTVTLPPVKFALRFWNLLSLSYFWTLKTNNWNFNYLQKYWRHEGFLWLMRSH